MSQKWQEPLTQKEIIETLCELMNDVARKIVNYPEVPADCFCGVNKTKWGNFQYDRRILDFVVNSVKEALNNIDSESDNENS